MTTPARFHGGAEPKRHIERLVPHRVGADGAYAALGAPDHRVQVAIHQDAAPSYQHGADMIE
jgi:hypothetical protein